MSDEKDEYHTCAHNCQIPRRNVVESLRDSAKLRVAEQLGHVPNETSLVSCQARSSSSELVG